MTDPILEIPFGGTIDESVREELVAPGTFTVAENIRQAERGGASKRLGFGGLTKSRFDGTTRSSGRRQFSHGALPATVDSDGVLDVYDPGKSAAVTVGRLPDVSVSTRTLALTTTTTLFGVVSCNGYVVAAGETVGNSLKTLYATVETADGQVVLSQRSLTSTSSANTLNAILGTYGVYVVAILVDSSSANITAQYIDLTSAASIATGWVAFGANIATDKVTSGTGAYIFSAHSLSDRIALAYVNSSGGTSQVSVKTITIAGVSQSTTVNTSSTTPTMVGVEGSSSDRLWVCWNESSDVKLIGLNPTSITSVTSTVGTIGGSGLGLNISAPTIVSSATAGAGRALIQTGASVLATAWTTSGGAVTSPGASSLPDIGISGRAFLRNGRYYAPFHVSVANEQGLFLLCDWTDVQTSPVHVRPIATVFAGLCVADLNVKHVHPITSGSVVSYGLAINDSQALPSPTMLVSFDFADIDRWRPLPYGESTYLSGGIVSYVDGATASEVGFLHAPAKPTGSGSGTGLTGTFRYVCVYEVADRAGNWVISGVSLPSEEIAVTNKTIDVITSSVVITNRVSWSLATIQISFFRTDASGEAPYYYVTSVPNGDANPTIADALADATLTTRRQLYGNGNLPGTDGAPQDRRAPPFAQAIAAYGDMMVVASGSDLAWSGQLVQGEGVWFNPAFSLTVPGSGAVTALAVQDDTLYVFKETSIYAVAGVPPSDNGSSGGLGTPRKLAVDVGSVGPVVCTTSLGIWFVSRRGIEVLTRAGAVEWVGERIQQKLVTYPVVTAIVYDHLENVVRVTAATSTSSGAVSGNGRTLVYDIGLRGWLSTDDVRGASASEAAQDACMLTISGTERFCWLGTDGTIRYEKLRTDADAHLDGSSWVTKRAVVGWLHTAGLNGEQFADQVLLLAKKVTDHDLTISIAFDYVESYTSARTFTAAQITALARQWLVKEVGQTTSTAIKIKVEDATPSSGTVGTGEGGTWVALTVNGVQHRGPKRSSGAQRGGTS